MLSVTPRLQVEAAFEGLRHVLKQAERRREARAKRLLQVRAAPLSLPPARLLPTAAGPRA